MSPQATLQQPATYQIQVGGRLEENWATWFDDMRVGTGTWNDGTTVTTLTGQLDQSALHGILRRIRDLGLLLLQVEQLPEP
jgi:hypothetical protein